MENSSIKVQLNGWKNNSKRAESLKKSKEEGKSRQKNQNNKKQSSRKTLQRTKKLAKSEKNNISDIASSYTKEKKKDLI